jgi:hypothetical protein
MPDGFADLPATGSLGVTRCRDISLVEHSDAVFLRSRSRFVTATGLPRQVKRVLSSSL